MNYYPDEEGDLLGVDLWKFSYLGNEMNMKDICLLKKVNFSRRPKTIDFFREKTKETSKGDLIQIHVDLFPMTIEIIDRWGSKDHDNP